MKYVDGFLVPVARKNLAAYAKVSKVAGKVWRELGALEYRECVGEDMNVPGLTGFSGTLQVKRGEVVVFSWITFKSRAHRDRVNKKVMADPRVKALCNPKKPVFDFTRMVYGGFEVFVDE